MPDFKVPEAIKKPVRCPLCYAEFAREYVPSKGTEVFFCHFCRIEIVCNDPCINRWEEMYSKGEKMICPSCEFKGKQQEMRAFFKSTGYALFQCPVKTCKARIETYLPDRKKDETQLYDAKGEPIKLPGVDRAIATPDAPAITQVMGDGRDPDLPAEVDFKLPPKQ